MTFLGNKMGMKPVKFNLICALPHLSRLEGSLLGSGFLPMEEEACPSLKLCHQIVQFPQPVAVPAESNLFHKAMKDREKTLCLMA